MPPSFASFASFPSSLPPRPSSPFRRTARRSNVAVRHGRPAAASALAGGLIAGLSLLGAAQAAPRPQVVAALDPAAMAWAWPAGIAAVAAAVPGALAPPPPPAPAPAAAPPAPDAGRSPARWEVRTQDITLSRTLERWAAQAGYRLKWDAARNFLIGASDVYQGGFEEALQAVLGSAGIRGSDYPLEACIYANTPPLVRITRQGEQSRECHAS